MMESLPTEDVSDWQMVRMLASENATQRGSTSAACLDAMAAISRVLAYNLLRWDEVSFTRILAKPHRLSSMPQTDKGTEPLAAAITAHHADTNSIAH